ncbi:MAG: hypothetical protein J6K52_04790 [Clostridia bacterium]|nr:hypothetical protein [Clostridia bacterium]
MMSENKKPVHKKMDIYKEKCRNKGFRKEDTRILGLLALTKDAVHAFGDSERAFDYLINLVDKYDNSQIIIDEFGTKIGLE